MTRAIPAEAPIGRDEDASALCAAVIADGERDAREIERSAAERIAELEASASEQAAAVRREALESARRKALRQRELVLATIPLELSRIAAARVESQLTEIRRSIEERIRDRRGFDVPRTFERLAQDAIDRMEGDSFVVALAPADHGELGKRLGDALRERYPGRKVTVVADETVRGTGPVVRTGDGRCCCDNRLEERLVRMWSELRQRIASRTGLARSLDVGGEA